ncbi:hypothetical protein L2E82_45322 [Cichorium intybus]|uniref:Uncharacterized protein n=2 Tax=Cichorium intybus TaxID=13427 RepID=A0ACB8ZSN6_CICIN|nr:hypothetical protein L2E82_45206 [Cichorium intybus]KAI3700685.1 hypothetical protein L2E82_45322 [Cichorium intybus]
MGSSPCNHRDAVITLALSPNSTCLASGSSDRSVKSGTMLATGGDDDDIKLINTIDGSVVRVLKGHIRSITGISFDPNSEYLASIDSFGIVMIYEL